jgi:hypothetical protein
MAPSGSEKVSPFSEVATVDGSAPPRSTPRSLGLIGDAATSMSTSSGFGFGTWNSSILKWTFDPEVTVEISRLPLDICTNVLSQVGELFANCEGEALYRRLVL